MYGAAVRGCLILVAGVLGFGPIFAQTGANLEIRGILLEPGVNRPIAGAEVTLTRGAVPANLLLKDSDAPPFPEAMRARVLEMMKRTEQAASERSGIEVAKAITSDDGTFHFSPAEFGSYIVSAKKNGYERSDRLSSTDRSPISASASVSLDFEHHNGEVQIFLIRPSVLIGRVVDADSGEPISNLPVRIREHAFRLGAAGLYTQNTVRSDSEGRLTATVKHPGRYIAIIDSRDDGAEQFLLDFSDEDLKDVDENYETSYWPAGSGPETDGGAQVQSGATVDLGVMRARKTRSYRVHVRVPKDGCLPGEPVHVELRRSQDLPGFRRRLGDVPCGDEFLIGNLPPEAYALKLFLNQDRAKEILYFEVGDRNLRLTASLSKGADIEGTVAFADDARPVALESATIGIHTVKAYSEYDSSKPDSQGTFRFANLSPGAWRVEVSGIGSSHYVREIRHNGAPCFDNVCAVTGPGTLEILLDDKPATLDGFVAEGDRPASKPHVVILRSSTSSDASASLPVEITGDQHGRFHFGGLAPGEYRMLAVAEKDAAHLDKPGALERLWANSEKIVLERATAQNIRLKLTDNLH